MHSRSCLQFSTCLFWRRFAPARCASFTSQWRPKRRRFCAWSLHCTVLPVPPYDVMEHRHKDNSSLEFSASLILLMNFGTSRTSSNAVDPGKLFHSNYIGSPSIVSNVLYCGESLNPLNCSYQTIFDVGYWYTFPRHNTESENTLTFVCTRLMTCCSPTKDKYFHEESSQLIVHIPLMSSDCSVINFSDVSNICFIVRSSVFLMECQLSE